MSCASAVCRMYWSSGTTNSWTTPRWRSWTVTLWVGTAAEAGRGACCSSEARALVSLAGRLGSRDAEPARMPAPRSVLHRHGPPRAPTQAVVAVGQAIARPAFWSVDGRCPRGGWGALADGCTGRAPAAEAGSERGVWDGNGEERDDERRVSSRGAATGSERIRVTGGQCWNLNKAGTYIIPRTRR